MLTFLVRMTNSVSVFQADLCSDASLSNMLVFTV